MRALLTMCANTGRLPLDLVGDGDLGDLLQSFFQGASSRGRASGFQRRRRSTGPVAGLHLCTLALCIMFVLTEIVLECSAGEDVQIQAEIDFMKALFGSDETLKVRRLEECKVCSGLGRKPGSKVHQCPDCGGQGSVQSVQRTPLGVFQSIQECPKCKGTGEVVSLSFSRFCFFA